MTTFADQQVALLQTFSDDAVIDIENDRLFKELQEAEAGRLLQARENEARRIARELHDDLGQGLALLTVKMDLLRQKPWMRASSAHGRRSCWPRSNTCRRPCTTCRTSSIRRSWSSSDSWR